MSRRIVGLRRAGFAAALMASVAFGLTGCEALRYQTASGPDVTVVREPAPAREPVAYSPPRNAEVPKRPEKVAATKQPAPTPAKKMDEAHCTGVNACAGVLKAMIADPTHSWMRRPAPASVLANGVRLFAYRALKPALSCDELAMASAEIESGDAALKRGVAGLSADQVTRARLLTLEVGQELTVEAAGRCGPHSKPGMVGAVVPADRQSEPRTVQ
jgi:hypothetical protein